MSRVQVRKIEEKLLEVSKLKELFQLILHNNFT